MAQNIVAQLCSLFKIIQFKIRVQLKVGLVSVLIISYISNIHKCSVMTMQENNVVFPLLHVFV